MGTRREKCCNNKRMLVTVFVGRSEKATNWGRRISGGVTSTVLGLVASNIGLIASEASAYTIANQYLLPLCLPLFLFSSDLRSGALASTRQLLPAFTLGSGIFLSYNLSLDSKNSVYPSGRTFQLLS